MRRTFAFVVVVVLAAPVVVATQWSQFRGPASDGVSELKGLPESWSTTENVRWKTPIPGHGWSSPIAWGDRIFVTSVIPSGQVEAPKGGLYFGGERPAPQVEHRWMVYAIDFNSGKFVWEREVHRGVPPASRHLKNTYASETPATDGRRVYVSFGNVGVFAYDFDGNQLWSRPAQVKPMRNGWGTAASKLLPVTDTQYGWGTASSPVVHGGRVFVVHDNDAQSMIVALDAATGRADWLAERKEGSNWSTPYVWQHAGGTEIVTTGTGAIRS